MALSCGWCSLWQPAFSLVSAQRLVLGAEWCHFCNAGSICLCSSGTRDENPGLWRCSRDSQNENPGPGFVSSKPCRSRVHASVSNLSLGSLGRTALRNLVLSKNDKKSTCFTILCAVSGSDGCTNCIHSRLSVATLHASQLNTPRKDMLSKLCHSCINAYSRSPTTFWTATFITLVFWCWRNEPESYSILCRFVMASRETAQTTYGLSLILSAFSHIQKSYFVLGLFSFIALSHALDSIEVPSSSWATKRRLQSTSIGNAGTSQVSLWPFVLGGALLGKLYILFQPGRASMHGYWKQADSSLEKTVLVLTFL